MGTNPPADINDQEQAPEELTPLNVVMIFVVIATCFAVCFLNSPPPERTPDGAVPWADGSVLKALTDALAFDFSIPTPLGVGVKNLVFGIACGVGAIIVSLGLFAASRSRERDFTLVEDQPAEQPVSHLKKQIDAFQGAQVLLVLLLAMSFLSSLWSPMAELAIGGSTLLLGQCLWVFAIRHGLNGRACRAAASGVAVVLTLTAALAVVYYYERNRTMRVGYPIGNPLFFAACLMPAVLICVCWIVPSLSALLRGRSRALICLGLCAGALVPLLWGTLLADPRSTYVGLAAGCVAIVFFALRGRGAKSAVVALTVVGVVIGYFAWLGPILEHRSETIRTRLHAWDYAAQLIELAPVVGHGQGGFALLGDSLTVQNVADDPRALHARLSHAHSEWLETWVDLGSVGLVITLGCFALTFWAGVQALRRDSTRHQRWLLLGLLSSLVALITEECFDVALRVAGLPTIFYTVLGLTWAVIGSGRSSGPPAAAPKGRAMVRGLLTACVAALGLLVSTSALLDFQASRALYDFQEKLQQRQWAAATEDVEFARRYRLSPSRKLTAYYTQAWCHLRIAEGAMQDFLVRAQAEADPQNSLPTEPLLSVGQEAVTQARRVLELVDNLSRHTEQYYGTYRLAGGAFELMRRMALATGDRGRAEQYRKAALAALTKEHERQPHDAGLAWHILELSGELSVAEVVKLICPPMQYHQVDERYYQLVQGLAGRPDFDAAFEPILTEALATLIVLPAGSAAVRYSAQKLRIAAWVAAGRREFADARAYARSALNLAEQERERFPIAYAIAHRELAHFTFLDDPTDPGAAVDIALKGMSLLPVSHEAEPVKMRMRERLTLYYLAAGEEQAALNLMPGRDQLKPEAVQAEMASLYLSLCQLLSSFDATRRPDYLPARLDRFDELCQTSQVAPQLKPAAAMFKANLALQVGDLSECVEHWDEAIAKGASPVQILEQAENAAQKHPQDEALTRFLLELRIQLTGPGLLDAGQ